MKNYLKDPLFLRQVIMDHYEYPRNKRRIEGAIETQMSTDSCIDDITVYLKVNSGIISDISFMGTACTIATASASIMTELLVNKTVIEANKIYKNYVDMLKLEPFDYDLLEEAVVFQSVGKQPHRISCARLAWDGFEKLAIQEGSLDHE